MSEHAGEPGTIELLVQRDHNVLGGLLDRFDTSPVGEWRAVFRDFFEYQIRHEVAEQEVLYPALQESVPGSLAFVEECEKEEHSVAVRLAIMEALDPSDPEFRDHLGYLRDEVAAHIAHEEEVILRMLRGQEDYDLRELASRYEVARTVAPGDPAAVQASLMPDVVPNSAGPLAGLADRIRDSLRNRRD
jgi:hypothetical protein